MYKEELLISAVCVCDNHNKILPDFLNDIIEYLSGYYSNFEIILVDNGSIDGTERTVSRLISQVVSVRYLRLTRPTDFETALMAGLDSAIGDFVVTINPDHDPISEINNLIDACRSGSDLALGQYWGPHEKKILYKFMNKIFVLASKWFFGVYLAQGVTSFRAISRHGVNALVKVRTRRRYFPLIISDIGLVLSTVPYRQISRSGYSPKLKIFSAIRAGSSVLVHNSIAPLRIASALGFAGSFIGLLYSFYVMFVYLFKSDVVQGWTTLSLAISLLSSIAFSILGLLGEYLGRLLEESGERPLYHLRDEISSSIMLTGQEKKNVLDGSEICA
jgi:glycosyltransferase involved in cell wall biosynthesis